jgi:DivIVA domain-containing protein
MPANFPTVARSKLGYDIREVDAFLLRARRAYDRSGAENVTAADLRHAAFGLEKGGYQTTAVDSALERLEDAFATREREASIRESGEKSWYKGTRKLASEIIERLRRPDGQRFDRMGALAIGYSVKEVDRFSERVRAYFEEGAELQLEEVRSVAFRPTRHGYREAQVDLLIDGVVEVMLAVK